MIYGRVSIFLLLYLWRIVGSDRLNEYIVHYEPLTYDHEEVHQHHLRAKRSASPNPFVHINFHAHGRQFELRLKRDTSVFAKDLRVEDSEGQLQDVDTAHIYSGHLWGEEGTEAYGSLHNGVFEGKIHTPKGAFYVERSHKYFPSGSSPYHSVIYSSDDVIDPFADKREGHFGGCGITDEVSQWMNEVSNSAVHEEDTQESSRESEADALKQDYGNPYDQLPSFGNRSKRSLVGESHHHMYTRDVQRRISHQSSPKIPGRKACTLYVQTDTFLWDHIKGYERSSSDSKVREEIASLIAQHIRAVNRIYENTKFRGNHGITFIVQRIKINDSSACDSFEKREMNPFCSPNIDVSNFLNLNSQFNHDDFCLAYIFTYRDFSGGTLGLAWVASTSGASGGICERYKPYTENINGRQVQNKRSLNTGIITFVNYNSRVPPKVSELTLAHEIGHNFGSPHDYPLECRPGGPPGNFIMYASATSGERPNNDKFSPCSVNNISLVLRAIFDGNGKENCFQNDDGPFCGNKIVEEGEECDCGFDEKECDEDCCYPKQVAPFLPRDPYAKPCQRRPNAQCSPSEGPCCNERCHFENKNKLCKVESDCNYNSTCDGLKATCPPPPPKPNKTECNEGTQVCWNGDCVGSICQKHDREECFLTAKGGSKPEEMCEVACQERSKPSTCRRTSEIPEMSKLSGLKLRPGSPCNDFQGYCDVFQKCRAVDAEGPLARLKNLLFNQKTLMSIRQWVTTYWWACMLMLVGLSTLMGLFIKCCAVHTPSSNPKKRPSLRIQDTLRHPVDTLRRKRSRPSVPTAPPGHPPPPYPGLRPTAPPAPQHPPAGPSHGYGEGRGHYYRRERSASGQSSRMRPLSDENPYAPPHPGRGNMMEMRTKPRGRT